MKLINIGVITTMIAMVNLQSTQATEFIVFIHGLAGFGRDELLGLGYWGFYGIGGPNYVTYMQQKTGLAAFEASVGPFSSNWDRACELYAQIKGVKTDYGKAHANQFSHSRYGRDFSGTGNYYKGGFFPTWGSANRVHLIGHSMGGQTIRWLERLIHQGDAAETALVNVASTGATTGGYQGDATPMSELFQTGTDRNWIASVTTIASPLDGSTLHTILDSTSVPLTNYIKNLLFFVAQGFGSQLATIYDMDLGHHSDFAGGPNSGESFTAYVNRIFASPKWSGSYLDLADYDMSPHKMKLFNAAGPRVYSTTRYFAIQTWRTSTCAFNWNDKCYQFTLDPSAFPMSITANIMGSVDDLLGYNDVVDDWGDVFDDSWEENDGLVSKRSSTGPTFGVPTSGPFSAGAPVEHPYDWGWGFFSGYYKIYKYNLSSMPKAQWFFFPAERDHMEAVGLQFFDSPDFIYDHIQKIINAIKNQA